MKLWCKVKIDQKIVAQYTSDIPDGIFRWNSENLHELIRESCSVLDTGCPVVLEKHAGEMARHRRTVFKAADFMEPVSFDQMEFELIEEKDLKKKELY